jgi:DNA-binding MarR family transcriptional regulator
MKSLDENAVLLATLTALAQIDRQKVVSIKQAMALIAVGLSPGIDVVRLGAILNSVPSAIYGYMQMHKERGLVRVDLRHDGQKRGKAFYFLTDKGRQVIALKGGKGE